MSCRRGLLRRGEFAGARPILLGSAIGRFYFHRKRPDDCNLARHPFLQQQFSRLHHRLGMEPSPHGAAVERRGQRHNRHPLMMRHVGADDRIAGPPGQPGAGVVDRFVEAVAAARTSLRQLRQIGTSRGRIDHRPQRRGIGRDDAILAQAPLQPEAGYAEIGILIGQFQVTRVVSGF